MNAARAAGMARCTLRRMSSQHRNLGRKLTFVSREMADLEFSASRSVFDFLFLTPNIFFYANQKQLCFFLWRSSVQLTLSTKIHVVDKHLANSPHGDLVLQPPNFRNQTDVFFSKNAQKWGMSKFGAMSSETLQTLKERFIVVSPPKK